MQKELKGRYNPINPVALSTTSPGCGRAGGSVSAVVGDNSDLMREVAALWINDDVDVVADFTFGRGVFWKKIAPPDYAHDLKTTDGVDFRNTPHRDASLDVVVLDPPYRPSHGSKSFGQNGLAKAYKLGLESLDTIADVMNLYVGGVVEAHRVLRSGGRIMVKCQDLSYGHRLHLVSLDILRELTLAGFDLADQFILVNQSRLTSTKWVNQERARRSHSILWVGIKP